MLAQECLAGGCRHCGHVVHWHAELLVGLGLLLIPSPRRLAAERASAAELTLLLLIHGAPSGVVQVVLVPGSAGGRPLGLQLRGSLSLVAAPLPTALSAPKFPLASFVPEATRSLNP